MNQQILQAEAALRQLGLSHWADKLADIHKSKDSGPEKASAILALYGGFGSLNDNGFSDGEAKNGMSGEEATSFYFASINALHRAAQQVLQADGLS
jgi:hypothetical protein